MNIQIQLERQAGFEKDDLVAQIPRMRAFARSLCRDRTQADDLTQEALAKAWRGRGGFTAGTNLQAWLFRIVRNQFYGDRRRSWRVVPLDPEFAENILVAVSAPNAALELDDVRRAMLELPDLQREALSLIAVAGLTYRDAAEICGCAEGTLKSRLSRARRALVEIMECRELKHPPGLPSAVMASILADAARAQLRSAA